MDDDVKELRRQLQRMQTQLRVVTGVLILLVVGGGLAALCGAAPLITPPKPQDITATRLTIVDAKGKKRIVLGVSPETDGSTLGLADSDGTVQVALFTSKKGPKLMFLDEKDTAKLQLGIVDGLAQVVLFDGRKEGGVGFIANPEGSLIQMRDSNGTPRLQMRCNTKGSIVTLYDKGEVPRIHLGAVESSLVFLRSKDGAREVELEARNEHLAVTLREPAKRAFRLWLPDDDGPAIQTQRKDEKAVPWKP